LKKQKPTVQRLSFANISQLINDQNQSVHTHSTCLMFFFLLFLSVSLSAPIEHVDFTLNATNNNSIIIQCVYIDVIKTYLFELSHHYDHRRRKCGKKRSGNRLIASSDRAFCKRATKPDVSLIRLESLGRHNKQTHSKQTVNHVKDSKKRFD
jgi:hypothetical protein